MCVSAGGRNRNPSLHGGSTRREGSGRRGGRVWAESRPGHLCAPEVPSYATERSNPRLAGRSQAKRATRRPQNSRPQPSLLLARLGLARWTPRAAKVRPHLGRRHPGGDEGRGAAGRQGGPQAAVPSSRLTRRSPSPAAAPHGHPCHGHGPGRSPFSWAVVPAPSKPPASPPEAAPIG